MHLQYAASAAAFTNNVGNGDTIENETVALGVQYINDGGTANGTTVNSGGELYIYEGGSSIDMSFDGADVYTYGGYISTTGQNAVNRLELRSLNTLTVSGKLSLSGEKKITFHLDDVVANSSFDSHTFIDNDTPIDLSGADVELAITDVNDLNTLSVGDSATLVAQAAKGSYDGDYFMTTGAQGATVYGLGVEEQDVSGQSYSSLNAVYKANRQATADNGRAYAEGRAADLTALKIAGDLIDRHGFSAYTSALKDAQPGRAAIWAIAGGGWERTDVGLRLKTKYRNLIWGAAKKFAQSQTGAKTTGGLFMETGDGDYSGGAFAAEGGARHLGLGALTRYERKDGFYLDGALRLGRVKNCFRAPGVIGERPLRNSRPLRRLSGGNREGTADRRERNAQHLP